MPILNTARWLDRRDGAQLSRCLALHDGQRCLGFILARGKAGYEAFDHDEVSRGLFLTQQEVPWSCGFASRRALAVAAPSMSAPSSPPPTTSASESEMDDAISFSQQRPRLRGQRSLKQQGVMAMSLQLDLFNNTDPLIGMKVQLPRPCPSCDNAFGVIGSSGGPYGNRIDCIQCGSWRHWLSKSEAAFITAVSEKFGMPATPIVLRKGV
jgi:hypothetical protein